MSRKSNNWDYQWGQIVGRAWADDGFNQRLRTDPAGVLTEYDLPPPAGVRIEVLEDPDRVPEDTDGVMHLVLPGKPSAAELSEEELCNVGGSCGRRPLWLRRVPRLRGLWRLWGLWRRPVCGALVASAQRDLTTYGFLLRPSGVRMASILTGPFRQARACRERIGSLAAAMWRAAVLLTLFTSGGRLMKIVSTVLFMAILAVGLSPAHGDDKKTETAAELKALDAKLTDAFKSHDFEMLGKHTRR